MARHAALSSLFGDDPFFSQGALLWPFPSLGRKVQLADHFFKDAPSLANFPTAFNRLSDVDNQAEDGEVVERQSPAQHAGAAHDDLLVTLDARGYAPSDITVKLEGRSLLVAATKQAGAEEAHSCSSPSSHASVASSASARVGFSQKIQLSPHLDLAGLSCSLMDDGQLRVHAPVARRPITEGHEEEQRRTLEGEEEEPPRFRASLEFPITKENTD
ncbi:heat shock protein beta-9 [Entelurus aequoreus]|uniref:heat shock protein beta-9 n=1 Tax=Entelurus aequoreus TaxID=161455 RepID=UPI002B1E584D|nr:heat shock protein beta-9 [Entelurus aequoreus]